MHFIARRPPRLACNGQERSCSGEGRAGVRTATVDDGRRRCAASLGCPQEAAQGRKRLWQVVPRVPAPRWAARGPGGPRWAVCPHLFGLGGERAAGEPTPRQIAACKCSEVLWGCFGDKAGAPAVRALGRMRGPARPTSASPPLFRAPRSLYTRPASADRAQSPRLPARPHKEELCTTRCSAGASRWVASGSGERRRGPWRACPARPAVAAPAATPSRPPAGAVEGGGR